MKSMDFAAPRAAGTTYFVYADYGYTMEREIFSSTDYAAAHNRFVAETSDASDMDCDVRIELASFAESGEFLVHDSQDAEVEAEADWSEEDWEDCYA